jgi:hypothetical protein
VKKVFLANSIQIEGILMFSNTAVRLIVVGLLKLMFLFGFSGNLRSQEFDPRLVNYDISGQIRFQSSVQAEERREELVRFIWSDGLPAARPVVAENLTAPEELVVIKPNLISRVDVYTANVSAMDFHSLSYVAYPVAPAPTRPRLAIVHAGHMPEDKERFLEAGLKESIERLLENGFIVAVIQMPMVAWNKDGSGILPNGQPFQIDARGTTGHDKLFEAVEPNLGGRIMAFFLEPVVQVTNELIMRHPNNSGLLMVGLSGGGWTTHFSAAIDPRITCSIPVAGALPMYARPHSKGSKGDAEQNYPAILGEEDTDNDGILDRATGVCSWLEIFALGALAPVGQRARQQTQVINFDDSCCFNGPVYQTYCDQLAKRVTEIGNGNWQVFVDRSHSDHVISAKVLDEVLMPMLNQIR